MTGISSAAVGNRLQVRLQGRFMLTGAPAPIPIVVVPAWRRAGALVYGSPVTIRAASGVVPVSGTVLIPRASTAETVQVYLTARVAGREYVSAAGAIAVAALPPVPTPAPSRPTARATPPPPPPTMRPATPTPAASPPRPTLPPPPTPRPTNVPLETPRPPVPTLPPAQSAARAASRLRLVPTSSAQVAPGESVTFELNFVLNRPTETVVENTVAWRERDGLHYGRFVEFTASPGQNTIRGLSFRVGTGTPVGTTFPLYGVLRIDGQLYRTQVALVITVVARGQVRTPAPPVGSPVIGGLEFRPTSATTVPVGGAANFELAFTLLNADQADVEVAVAWQEGGGAVTFGPFSPLRATAGRNQVRLFFRVGTALPGTTFQVFAVVRYGGTTYRTPAVTITVGG